MRNCTSRRPALEERGVRAVLADVDEALGAPEITPAEHGNLLACVVRDVRPEESGDVSLVGVVVNLKRSLHGIGAAQPMATVAMISIHATVNGAVRVEVHDDLGRRAI